MGARELRIGNLLGDGSGRLCRVEEISRYEFKAPAIVGALTTLPNKPMPLTEEWLIKLGFERGIGGIFPNMTSDGEPYYSIPLVKEKPNESRLCVAPNGGAFIYNGDPGYGADLCYDLSGVHQLQNLYFALTEEELTLQPEAKGPKPYKLEDEG